MRSSALVISMIFAIIFAVVPKIPRRSQPPAYNQGFRPLGAILSVSYPVGSNPQGVAFDGANIWVCNFNSDTVSKLRANDGVLQGTFAVGASPSHAISVGTQIWVSNSGNNTVTNLRAADGNEVGTYKVGAEPAGLAFDGLHVWVAQRGANSVSKLRASDGVVVGTFNSKSASSRAQSRSTEITFGLRTRAAITSPDCARVMAK